MSSENKTKTPFARPPTSRLWRRMVLFAVAYFLCAEAGSYLSIRDGTFVSFWLPSGLFVAVLLMNPTRDWLWLVLAVFPAGFVFDYLHGTKPAIILCFYGVNTFQAMTGAWLVRRFVAERPSLSTLKEFVGLAVLAGIVSAMSGACLGAITLVHFGMGHTFANSWKIWWGSNAMAILLLTTFILTWFPAHDGARKRQPLSPAKLAEMFLLFLGMSGIVWYMLAGNRGIQTPNRALLIPFLLWSGLRFGSRGATAAGLFLALVLAFFTTQFSFGLTPEQILSGSYVFHFQTVLAMGTLVSLIPAIVLDERDRTMAKLRESEEKFSKAFRTSPDVMSIMDFETGCYLEVNEAHKKIFGFKHEEVIGRSPLQLNILENPAVRERTLAELKERGFIRNVEIETRTRDGTALILRHSAELIELGGRLCVLSVSHDITDGKRAEESLRKSEEQFRSYFEQALVGCAITSVSKGVLTVNNQLCQMLGYSREELQTMRWDEFTHPDDVAADETQLNRLVRGEIDSYKLDKRFIRKDGQIIYAAIAVRCVRHADGSPNYIVGLAVDITDRHKAILREQQARAQYTFQLIASQEAERARIAAELHDSLGQNLLLIKNLSQMALRDLKPEAIYEHISSINHLAAQCIAETRQISRDLHPHQLDHLGLKRALEAMLENIAEASTIRFAWKIDDADELFSTDAAMNIYRIVQEGVNNILKHSHAQRASVRLERDLHEVLVHISDDGCGLAPDDDDQKKANKGLGLKNIIERVRMLGGIIKLESAPGKGLSFEVHVPIAQTS